MRPYAERRAARIERLRARADKLQSEGERRVGGAKRIADGIPLGQPILVGHHSERRHRRDVERIHNGFAKGYELQKQASEVSRRADAAEENTAISSDDPEAIGKLRAKLGDLSKLQERMKVLNALFRKGGFELMKSVATEVEIVAARRLLLLCPYEKKPYPPYVLSNNSANMRRVDQRIAALEARAARPAREAIEIGGVTIDEEDNRTRVHFPSKPAREVVEDLKRHGFRWCRSDGCWQRQASDSARALAVVIVERGSELGKTG